MRAKGALRMRAKAIFIKRQTKIIEKGGKNMCAKETKCVKTKS